MTDNDLQEIKYTLYQFTNRLESIERKVDSCMKEIAVIKEGGNI